VSTTYGKYHGKPAPCGKIASLVLDSSSEQVALCRALMEMWVQALGFRWYHYPVIRYCRWSDSDNVHAGLAWSSVVKIKFNYALRSRASYSSCADL
jgi:hypothetical protein